VSAPSAVSLQTLLLGALTLEALGLTLDPIRRELRPMPLVL